MRVKQFGFKKRKKVRRWRWPALSAQTASRGRVDYLLVSLITVLTIGGLIVLSSASNQESFRRYQDTYYLFRHQLLFGLLPGLVLLVAFSRISYQKMERYAIWFLIAALVLLVLVFIPGLGMTYGRARSWVRIASVSFQPTEMVKLLLILFLAAWFSQRGKEMTRDFWNGLIPFILILSVISLPIILQPDIGTLAVVVAIALVMYFVAGGRPRHLAGLFVAGVGLLGLLIAQAPYRAARLMTFLHPEFDPEGIGYHINQAFLAIGSGGWFGLGLGQSRQKLAYLPEVIGDSIFAIVAEELGFIVSGLLIAVFLTLLLRGFKLAQQTQSDYGRYLAVGISTWFASQAFFNIGAMVGLLPLTGIPLPFISYGGTALTSTLAAGGILISISRRS